MSPRSRQIDQSVGHFPKRAGHSFSDWSEGGDDETGNDDQPDDSQSVPEPGAESDAPGILVVVAVGEALQEHKRDEEQCDDKVDSVHESKRERSIAESDFLSGFLLWKQAGKSLRLKNDEGDADHQGLQHPSPEQALPFAPNVIAGRLQAHTAQDQ